MPVCVWMEKRALASRWVTHEWHAAAVTLEGAPEQEGGAPGWIAHAGHSVSLHRDEAEGYYLNTSSGDPKVFVMWRLEEATDGVEEAAVPRFVTLSYNEAGRLMDAQEKVETVPIPPAMLAWLQTYVAENYKPEPKKKRARSSFVSPADRSKL